VTSRRRKIFSDEIPVFVLLRLRRDVPHVHSPSGEVAREMLRKHARFAGVESDLLPSKGLGEDLKLCEGGLSSEFEGGEGLTEGELFFWEVCWFDERRSTVEEESELEPTTNGGDGSFQTKRA